MWYGIVLASSIRLGFPLPERLPNTDRARDRLLAKLFTFREQVRGTEGESDEDFALIYAYGKTPIVTIFLDGTDWDWRSSGYGTYFGRSL